MHATVQPALRQFLGRFEGVCDFMYLDNRGLVTTGIGNLLPSPAAAQALDWQRNSDDAEASDSEVAAEWNQINDRQEDKERGGMYFRRFANLHLSSDAIEALFRARAHDFAAELQRIFTDFPNFPGDAQLAMLVHAWAVGTGKLLTEWPSYSGAIRTRDWERAGRECIWRQLRSQREHAVSRRDALQLMFGNAAQVENAIRAGTNVDLTRIYYPQAATTVAPAAPRSARRPTDPIPLARHGGVRP